MEFNIKHFIQKKTFVDTTPESKIIILLQKYNSSIGRNNISFKKGILFLKNISPIQKTDLKLKKRLIIKELKDQDLFIRDII